MTPSGRNHKPSAHEQNGIGGPIVLMAAITATELAMLNVIFWVRAQGTYAGLVLAVTWPWVAAFLLPFLWAQRGRRLIPKGDSRVGRHPRLAAGIGLALAVAILLERLMAVA
jgi:hypothetical protein